MKENHRAFFYRRSITDPAAIEPNPMKPGSDSSFPVNAMGELLEDSWDLVCPAFVSVERASKPIEIIDATVQQAQVQYVLNTSWNSRLLTIDTTCICWVPSKGKVYEVIGEPVDHTGERRRLLVYVTDNVLRSINTALLPMP